MIRGLFAALLAGSLTLGALAGWVSHNVRVPLSNQVAIGDRYMGIRLLGSLRLSAQAVDGFKPHGLSGLSWDEDAGLLYAISDDAKLFHIRPVFSDGLLTDAQFVAAYPLRDKRGKKPLRWRWTDSEGLDIENGANGVPGDSQLIVSFERQPRIARFSPTGKWLRDEALPALLRDVNRYADPNKALEAVALHKQWGVLTAPERPLREGPEGYIPIAALNRSWLYPLSKAPNSGLVAMEALPDGSLLTLERAFVSPLYPLVISLRRVQLPTQPQVPLPVEDVAVFDTSKGWLLDNFEGLTRHRDRRFFMISDDNGSLLQNTLLVYFELLPPSGGSDKLPSR